MGTFLICAREARQKGTYLLQVRPLLLANEECPHFLETRNVPIYLPRTPPVSTMRIACSTVRSVSVTRLRGM